MNDDSFDVALALIRRIFESLSPSGQAAFIALCAVVIVSVIFFLAFVAIVISRRSHGSMHMQLGGDSFGLKIRSSQGRFPRERRSILGRQRRLSQGRRKGDEA